MRWVFKLIITNGTNADLTAISSNIPWGTWYRDNTDKRGPATVPAGQTIEALGIRAAVGTWTGYECSAIWAHAGKPSLGSLSLNIDVPFSGSNHSKCTPSGALKMEGWSNLPKSGHNFVRNITISPSLTSKELQVESDVVTEEDEEDRLYKQYLLDCEENNPDLRDWDSVQKMLEEVDTFEPTNYLPEKYEYPLKKYLIGRSFVYEIPKNLWPGVGDADCTTDYSKQLFVDKYFAVSVYSINTNPRDRIPLAKGESITTKKIVTISSTIKNILETTWSIKASLGGKHGDAKQGSEIAWNIESQFSVKNVREESTTHVDTIEKSKTFTAKDHDELIVPWVFSKAVLIYRTSKKGKVQLIAASEWAEHQLYKTYEY